jgi:hypothetical protein
MRRGVAGRGKRGRAGRRTSRSLALATGIVCVAALAPVLPAPAQPAICVSPPTLWRARIAAARRPHP